VYFAARVHFTAPAANASLDYLGTAERLTEALAPQLGLAGSPEALALTLSPAGEPGAAHLAGRATLSAEDATLSLRALATVQGAFSGCEPSTLLGPSRPSRAGRRARGPSAGD